MTSNTNDGSKITTTTNTLNFRCENTVTNNTRTSDVIDGHKAIYFRTVVTTYQNHHATVVTAMTTPNPATNQRTNFSGRPAFTNAYANSYLSRFLHAENATRNGATISRRAKRNYGRTTTTMANKNRTVLSSRQATTRYAKADGHANAITCGKMEAWGRANGGR